ncbi:hypothetical protein OIO90_001235 [Microbotryomycetes sp. JL221]|nr:hypothetical protein OIO90_001235 [Microbotryomycetes sp. JL221]
MGMHPPTTGATPPRRRRRHPSDVQNAHADYILGQHQWSHLAHHFKAFMRVTPIEPHVIRYNDSCAQWPVAPRGGSSSRRRATTNTVHHPNKRRTMMKRAQLDDQDIDAFDCLYLGQSTDQADKEEYDTYCNPRDPGEIVNDVGFKHKRTLAARRRHPRQQQQPYDDDDDPLAFHDTLHTNTNKRKRIAQRRVSTDDDDASHDATGLRATPTTLDSTLVKHFARQVTATTSSPSLDPTQLASLSSAQLASLESGYESVRSVLSTRSLAGSAVPEALFSSVLNDINSAQAAILSRQSIATASTTSSSTVPSTTEQSSSVASSQTASTSQQLSTSSGAQPSSTGPVGSSNNSNNNNSNRIRNIVVPSVVIPVGLILLGILLYFCLKRRSKHENESSSNVVGPISNPIPTNNNRVTGRQTQGQISNESFATSPSAIGVAISDPQPRTKWGRRSFIEAFAAGRAARNRSSQANTTTTTSSSPQMGEPQAVSTSTVQGAGRQPSVTNMAEIMGTAGVAAAAGGAATTTGGMVNTSMGSNSSTQDRAYSPTTTYRPGMQRPLMSSITHHYDPFVQPPSIVAVPQRRSSSLSGASMTSRSEYERSERGSMGNLDSTTTVEPNLGARGVETAAAAVGAGSTNNNNQHDEDEIEEVRSDLPPPIPPIPLGESSPYHQFGHFGSNSSASVIGGGRIRRMQTGETTTSGEGQFYTASSGGDSIGSNGSHHRSNPIEPTTLQQGNTSSNNSETMSSTDLSISPQQAPVNFGSSGSSGGGGNESIDQSSRLSIGTPRPESVNSVRSTGTPRLGAGHGSMSGMRKGDGSWW